MEKLKIKKRKSLRTIIYKRYRANNVRSICGRRCVGQTRIKILQRVVRYMGRGYVLNTAFDRNAHTDRDDEFYRSHATHCTGPSMTTLCIVVGTVITIIIV